MYFEVLQILSGSRRKELKRARRAALRSAMQQPIGSRTRSILFERIAEMSRLIRMIRNERRAAHRL